MEIAPEKPTELREGKRPKGASPQSSNHSTRLLWEPPWLISSEENKQGVTRREPTYINESSLKPELEVMKHHAFLEVPKRHRQKQNRWPASTLDMPLARSTILAWVDQRSHRRQTRKGEKRSLGSAQRAQLTPAPTQQMGAPQVQHRHCGEQPFVAINLSRPH